MIFSFDEVVSESFLVLHRRRAKNFVIIIFKLHHLDLLIRAELKKSLNLRNCILKQSSKLEFIVLEGFLELNQSTMNKLENRLLKDTGIVKTIYSIN